MACHLVTLAASPAPSAKSDCQSFFCQSHLKQCHRQPLVPMRRIASLLPCRAAIAVLDTVVMVFLCLTGVAVGSALETTGPHRATPALPDLFRHFEKN
jgi:hypothetical protein